MKIAIISNGFSGATLPLAQHLYDEGNIVDNYYIVTMGARCIESIDFSTSIPYKTTPVILPLSNRLYKYLSPHIKVTLLPTFRKMIRLEKMGVGKILPLINRYLIRHYLKKIELNKYDVVNVVVHTEYEVIVCKELKKMKIPFIISYHEVLKQLTGNIELKQEVLQTINCAPIIVHSDNTRHELCQHSNISPNNVQVIHFGAFESYKSYDDMVLSKAQEFDYFLYLGYIKPYKGLKCLYDASKYLSQSIRFIIAGGGYDESLDKFKQNSNFKIINRFLSNEEVASLIRNCKAVVLPYISASQSGLVQTAMVYGKPVIATRVGAFSEIIKDKKNGILVQPANATELANAINSFDQYEFASVYSEEYAWNYITHQYLELFKKTYENN